MNLPQRARLRITNQGLQVARHALGLITESKFVTIPDTSRLEDAIFVSIHVKHIGNIKEGLSPILDFQAGLAILDTRCLCGSHSIISTYHFAFGSDRYCAKAKQSFLFGETTLTTARELSDQIKSLLPPSRNVILVSYRVIDALYTLEALGVNFRDTFVAVLDTAQVANEALSIWSGGLSNLLVRFGCPFDGPSSAGNYAHLNLRALLLLATYNSDEWFDSDDVEPIDTLEELAYSKLPCWKDPERMAERKLTRLLEKSLRYQSKFGDAEKQAQTRAERAEKRRAKFAQEQRSLKTDVSDSCGPFQSFFQSIGKMIGTI